MIQKGEIEGRLDCLYIQATILNSLKSKFKTYPLNKLVSTLTGGTPDKSNANYWNGNIFWVSPKDFKELKTFESEDKITSEGLKKSSTKLIESESVLVVVRSGILQHTLPVTVNQIDVAINQDIKALIIKDKAILNPYYLAYYFNTFQKSLLPLIVKHSTTVQSINTEQFDKIEIPVPPIDIQNEVIKTFENANTLKSQKEAEAAALLESIDDYLLQELGITLPPASEKKTFFIASSKQLSGNRFDPFYHQTEFEKLEQALINGKYPLEKLGNFLSQINYGASVKNEYADSGIPFLRISDLTRNEISVKEMMYLPESMRKDLGNAFVYEDDFLISRSGTLGVVALVTKEINGFAYGSFMIKFKLRLDAKVNKNYLLYFLNSEVMQKIVARNKIGAIQGNITIPTIKNLPIPFPSLEKQTEIANHISAIRFSAKQLEQQAAAELEQAKQHVEKLILGENHASNTTH